MAGRPAHPRQRRVQLLLADARPWRARRARARARTDRVCAPPRGDADTARGPGRATRRDDRRPTAGHAAGRRPGRGAGPRGGSAQVRRRGDGGTVRPGRRAALPLQPDPHRSAAPRVPGGRSPRGFRRRLEGRALRRARTAVRRLRRGNRAGSRTAVGAVRRLRGVAARLADRRAPHR